MLDAYKKIDGEAILLEDYHPIHLFVRLLAPSIVLSFVRSFVRLLIDGGCHHGKRQGCRVNELFCFEYQEHITRQRRWTYVRKTNLIRHFIKANWTRSMRNLYNWGDRKIWITNDELKGNEEGRANERSCLLERETEMKMDGVEREIKKTCKNEHAHDNEVE